MPRADFSAQPAFDYDDYPPGQAYRLPGAAPDFPRQNATYEDDGGDYGSLDLMSAQRVGAPLPSRWQRRLRRSIMTLCLLGTGYAAIYAPQPWKAWLSEQIASVMAAFEAPAKIPSGPPTGGTPSIAEQKAAPQPLASNDVADAPQVAAPVVVSTPQAVPEATAGPSDGTEEKASPSPLPPPPVNPADPLETRAVAAGLHPGLSRALLRQLTPADYRNAQVAIHTALAETPDSQVFEFPRPRTAEQALFEVHFVPGAPSACRRYVVTVTKDRWLTTALPMEKCALGSIGYSAATKRG